MLLVFRYDADLSACSPGLSACVVVGSVGLSSIQYWSFGYVFDLSVCSAGLLVCSVGLSVCSAGQSKSQF